MSNETPFLSQQALQLQLACLSSGILWEGTLQQIEASYTPDNCELGPGHASTIDRQLASLSPDDARRIRRKFRKLWRTGARRRGISPEVVKDLASKRRFAYQEVLHRAKVQGEQDDSGG